MSEPVPSRERIAEIEYATKTNAWGVWAFRQACFELLSALAAAEARAEQAEHWKGDFEEACRQREQAERDCQRVNQRLTDVENALEQAERERDTAQDAFIASERAVDDVWQEADRLRAVVDSLRAALDEAGDELKVVADQAHGGTDRSTCTRGLCGKLSRWATLARAAAETEGM